MRVVKGSKQDKMIVVPYRPAQAWGLRALVACLLLVCVVASYVLGRQQGLRENGAARLERDELAVAMEVLGSENDALKAQLLNQQQSGEVDKQALAQVQETVRSLRENISQLQEDVLFYKQISSSENTEQGLVVGQMELFATTDPQRLRYKFEFRQQGGSGDMIKGHANIEIQGKQDGMPAALPLYSVSNTEKMADIKLGFRYFQNLEGELTLPPGFAPERIHIHAESDGDDAQTLQQSFAWVVRN